MAEAEAGAPAPRLAEEEYKAEEAEDTENGGDHGHHLRRVSQDAVVVVGTRDLDAVEIGAVLDGTIGATAELGLQAGALHVLHREIIVVLGGAVHKRVHAD